MAQVIKSFFVSLFVFHAFCFYAFASDNNYTDVYKVLPSFSSKEIRTVYNFGVLFEYSNQDIAKEYWDNHKIDDINEKELILLSKEVLNNSLVQYKTSILKSVFTLTGIMISVAVLFAVVGVLGLFLKNWEEIVFFVKNKFYPKIVELFYFLKPVIKVLSSRLGLTITFFVLGIVFYVVGLFSINVIIRTVLIHAGGFLILTQLLQLFSQNVDNIKMDYIFRFIEHGYKSDWTDDNYFIKVTFPLFCIFLCSIFAFVVSGDWVYSFWIIVFLMLAFASFSGLGKKLSFMSRIIFPNYKSESDNYICFVSVLMIFVPILFFIQKFPVEIFIASAIINLIFMFFLIIGFEFSNKLSSKFDMIYINILFLVYAIGTIISSVFKENLWFGVAGVFILCLYLLLRYLKLLRRIGYFGYENRWSIFIAISVFLWSVATIIRFVFLRWF